VVKPKTVKKEVVAAQEHPPFKLGPDPQKRFDKWRKICQKEMPNEAMKVEYIENLVANERRMVDKKWVEFPTTLKNVIIYTIGDAKIEFYNCIPKDECTDEERYDLEAKALKTLGIKNGVLGSFFDFQTHYYVQSIGKTNEQIFVKKTEAIEEALKMLGVEQATPAESVRDILYPVVEKLREEEWPAEESFHKEILMHARAEAVKAQEKYSPEDPIRGFTPFKVINKSLEFETEQPVKSYEALQGILKANKIVRVGNKAIFLKADKRKEIFLVQAAV
jgi:hypothetical protein